MDKDDDGVGDIPGIISKLDYIKGGDDSLGADAIWLSPFYRSPMKDFGYDISDHCDVDPVFGTLADVDRLLAAAHDRDIKVMIDLVPNHTSSESSWFVGACQSRESPLRDYYIFRDPQPDGSPPNNWLSVFGGSAWEYHAPTHQYYLHSFLKEQPDLNWENLEVQEAMRRILRFWLDRGVDGFRVDAIRWMGKNPELMNDPINDSYQQTQDPYEAVEHKYSRSSPELTTYLRVLTNVLHEYDDKIMIFEDHLDSLSPTESQVRRMYSIDSDVAAPFNFQAMHIPFSSHTFSEMVTTYQGYLFGTQRPYYCFSNHDESRLATRFGREPARMLSALQLLLPGTPVIYYGQEIGMTDAVVSKKLIKDSFGRDRARTPMRWSNERHGGFTYAHTPWLPVGEDVLTINVQSEQTDDLSVLRQTQQLLRLREQHQVLRDGTYRHEHTDSDIFAYTLQRGDDCLIVVSQFSNALVKVPIYIEGEVLFWRSQPKLKGQIVKGHLDIARYDTVVIRQS